MSTNPANACSTRTPDLVAPAETIIVEVWDDGFGNFQARCQSCPWRGPWRETGRKDQRNPKAIADAKDHLVHVDPRGEYVA